MQLWFTAQMEVTGFTPWYGVGRLHGDQGVCPSTLVTWDWRKEGVGLIQISADSPSYSIGIGEFTLDSMDESNPEAEVQTRDRRPSCFFISFSPVSIQWWDLPLVFITEQSGGHHCRFSPLWKEQNKMCVRTLIHPPERLGIKRKSLSLSFFFFTFDPTVKMRFKHQTLFWTFSRLSSSKNSRAAAVMSLLIKESHSVWLVLPAAVV